jgi:hypothetical protein
MKRMVSKVAWTLIYGRNLPDLPCKDYSPLRKQALDQGRERVHNPLSATRRECGLSVGESIASIVLTKASQTKIELVVS